MQTDAPDAVSIHGDAPGIAAAALQAGLRIADDGAVIVVTTIMAVEDAADEARQRRQALVAIVGADDADAAIEAGATHVVSANADPAEVARTLRLAVRHVRRLRDLPSPARRRGESEVVPAWVTAARPVALALIALTRFDVVNAAYGRARGDRLLESVLARLRSVVGPGAQVERLDGAEVLIAWPDPAGASDDAIEQALAEPFDIDRTAILLGSRVAVLPVVQGDVADTLRHLRLRIEEPSASPLTGSVLVEQLAIDVHRAIENGEIGVLFQPQVVIATGAISGVEALARWAHPTRGEIGAELLFAAAERADVALPLSEHVQAAAIAAAAAWPESLARLRLSINVTAADLARSDFAPRLLAQVDASGFARGRLTVEITESGLIAELNSAARLLSHLRGAGCHVAIDDFGTGYSSLAYLKALPLDYLKIDRSLTVDIAGSDRDRVVVRGVIAMARSLGLETIAEGVEDARQRDLLAAEGCTLYQGYLCAPPLTGAALVDLVEGR
ncbi:conserved hypothetical protein [Sphingomonas sp. EC-HK361]|uniref:bifunctional diguanylate cyclase/phosphodiesterase n=1 Tax=Sphingomonas sp. EC-HK361 TaxID=2038397 RepID=UPI00125A7A6C|nr:bifunctional diguanylate cyclase/phosphodiesterase [Sphingomonas sp. EC-HK361]VVT06198.1 conserved hypothetical protein [Sphingomonas sp. EC-HK361]